MRIRMKLSAEAVALLKASQAAYQVEEDCFISQGNVLGRIITETEKEMYEQEKMGFDDVDWPKVLAVDIDTIPPNILNAKRVDTDLNIARTTEAFLEKMRQKIKEQYPGITRTVYLPFVIRLLLKLHWFVEAGRGSEFLRPGTGRNNE